MSVTIELPESIATQLQSNWGDLSRRALEALAVEAYRAELVSQSQVGEILGLDFWETERFLKERRAFLHYDEDDLQQDKLAHERVLLK
jgi:predicted HTH domain antitoxin